jgi:hypothetical protein
MDAGGATDESAYLRTVKSCGPDAPTLASSSREAKLLEGEGGNKARSPGRARRKPLKPSRAGMPGDLGATVVTNARAYYSTRAAAGASGTRHSPLPLGVAPRPLWANGFSFNSGAPRRGMADVCLMNRDAPTLSVVVARESGRSSIPSVHVGGESSRRTGYSAFAEYDGSCISRVDASPGLRQACSKATTSGGHRCSARKTINS